jgi:hypothetical protein
MNGSEVTVVLKNGARFTGLVDRGHYWANECNVLCLASGKNGKEPNLDAGEAVWVYINREEIAAIVWDCA